MARRSGLVAAAAVVVVAGLAGGAAVAAAGPALTTSDPTSVEGTDGTAVFDIGTHHIRQVRYQDRGTLRYTFRLHNDGALPLTVTGLAEDQPRTRLFRATDLTGDGGEHEIRIGPGGSQDVTLALLMSGCETLSARAGSLLTEVVLSTERAGVLDDEVSVQLPEELRTGSPREAFCPGATATSRPRG